MGLEILDTEFAIVILAHGAHNGTFCPQTGRRHHAGGHLAAALPAGRIYLLAAVGLGELIHRKGQINARHINAGYLKFFHHDSSEMPLFTERTCWG